MKDQYFAIVLEIDLLHEWVGLPSTNDNIHHLFPSTTPGLKRDLSQPGEAQQNFRDVENDFEDYESLSRATPEQQWAALQKRQASTAGKVNPNNYKTACFTYNIPIKGQSKHITFFNYCYSIPVYAGTTLDLCIGAGLDYGVTVGIQFCFLSLSAGGTGGPYAAVTVTASAAISFFIIRAGIMFEMTLLGTNLTANVNIGFSTWPLNLCFDLTFKLTPLTITISLFVQLRLKIVFLGLDWLDPWTFPIGTWGVDPITIKLIDTCQEKEDPAPTATNTNVETKEDTNLIDAQLEYDNSHKGMFYLDGSGEGFTLISDLNKGIFTYYPPLNSDRKDNFTFVASDGSANSDPAYCFIKIWPVADAPLLEVANAEGWEGKKFN